jgi:hypothetical protein
VSIRAKLYAAIALSTIGPVLTTAIALAAMSTLGDRFTDVERSSANVELALNLKFGVTDFNGWQTAYGYDDGASRPRYEASLRAFQRDLATARRRFTRGREKTLTDALTTQLREFVRLDRLAYEALQNDKPEVTKRIFLGPEIRQFEAMAATAQQLADQERRSARVARVGFTDARMDARRKLVAVALGAGIVIVLLLITAQDVARRALEERREEARA